MLPSAPDGLTPESEILLALSWPDPSADDQRRIRSYLHEHGKDIDWGRFFDQAARHMVLPLVARNITRLRLAYSEEGRPLIPYRWIYSDVYEGSRLRNMTLGDEYARVIRALNDAGPAYAIRKGPVMGEHVYGDPAVRRITNLDVFTTRADHPALKKVVDELGYASGHLSANGQRVVSFDRSTDLYWKINLTNATLPYTKAGSTSLVDMYIVTGWFSLFQPATGIQDDAVGVLRRSVPVSLYGEPSFMLDPVDQLIDSCVQVHVRATLLYYIESGKDLTLRNFIDLVMVLKRAPADFLETFRKRVHQYGCSDSVHYSLHYARMLYPAQVSASLVKVFRPSDVSYLDQYGGFDGQCHRWQQEFMERLFDPQRSLKVAARSAVPGPRSVV